MEFDAPRPAAPGLRARLNVSKAVLVGGAEARSDPTRTGVPFRISPEAGARGALGCRELAAGEEVLHQARRT